MSEIENTKLLGYCQEYELRIAFGESCFSTLDDMNITHHIPTHSIMRSIAEKLRKIDKLYIGKIQECLRSMDPQLTWGDSYPKELIRYIHMIRIAKLYLYARRAFL